ncbi:MAG: hypothetical protein Q9195_007242 [Heterodermia aff. obscurata]
MESPIPPDPYKTLGIDKNAPLATVRSAHRKLVLTCHPDKVTDESAKKAASDKFHLVQQAYEILSDETRRERYDERVKLADLRAQMMKEKGGSRIISDIGIRGGPKRTHEMRDNTIYEYREPREPPPRSRAYEEEDYFQPRYQEVRPKKYDDHSFVPTPRKTSGRAAEDKRRARDLEDERERKKEMSRAEDKARAERSRRRGMDRKKDYEYKNHSSRKFAPVQDDEDSTDSDSTEPFIRPRREEPPKKRYDDERRREKDDTPRRSTKRDPYDDYDDKASRAQDYITQSRSSVEPPEPRRLAQQNRSFSYVERPPPPPAAPIVPPVDTSARRSSARDSRRRESSPPRLSKKDRRMTEIVDPPPSSRKPSLPFFSSDPKGLKNMTPRRDRDREPQRAATLEHTSEPRIPTIRRSETLPSNPRRTDNAPTKSSKLKEPHDSGYSSRSSRGTPELSPAPSPQMKSTIYRYNEGSEDDEDTIVAEPETYRRHRDDSPPTSRRERPKMSSRDSKLPGRDPTSTRPAPTMRSGSYAVPTDQINPPRQPPSVRTESGRPPPLKSRASARGSAPLYGEVEVPEPYEIVNHSPKYRPGDIRYTDYPRRGSADDRDAYPGSPRHRPDFSRSESRAVHA